MNEYELIVLFNEGRTAKWCENYLADLLTDKKYKFENDGVKRLAYHIDGEEKARYTYVSELLLTTMEASALTELLCSKRNKGGMLKYLLVKARKRTTNWDSYIEYLKDWARQHEEIENEGMSPVCYDEFLDNEKGDF